LLPARMHARPSVPTMLQATWRRETEEAHREHLSHIATSNPIHLCLLGASLIKGWERMGAEAWRRAGLPTGDDRLVLNAGVPGDGIEHLLWRLSPQLQDPSSMWLRVSPRSCAS
jgi:hypothetical protein